ncbi:hypothetical protein SUGI_0977160 [Cryptomeria japonica]|uniref:uncharacterized protein LOC131067402 n=1 Tax=Cryptomeria japonica TaxID=3369 RepID=UPI0024146A6A|nr:uncharacterized protein LOC131067402 [Cryptomeria japonica]GLJ46357.1 hypothetical protein SUGI_0977160 [Cryptomeria japonica]
MGSYLSCGSSHIFPSNTVKVVAYNGELQEFQKQIKAAELMLENPQHFVCHADSLQVGRRINPLSADEDLELGHLYFLLPMSKLQGVVSDSDMASIAVRAKSAMKKGSKNFEKKIIPLFGDMVFQDKARDHDDLGGDLPGGLNIVVVPKMDVEGLSELQIDLGKYRLSKSRSWRPNLETIREADKPRA